MSMMANRSFYVIPAKAGILLCILGLLIGCSSKSFDSKEELWTYIKDPDNGYRIEKNINGVDFSLLYKPTDLLVQQELNSKNPEEIKRLRDKYGKYIYFNLSMSKNNKELLSAAPKNRNEFGAMVNQLAFGMGDKVHLYTQHKDTIALSDYNYPRMYGMSQSTSMLFVYPKAGLTNKDEMLNFTIQDLGLDTGEVKFKVPIMNIQNQPTLTF